MVSNPRTRNAMTPSAGRRRWSIAVALAVTVMYFAIVAAHVLGLTGEIPALRSIVSTLGRPAVMLITSAFAVLAVLTLWLTLSLFLPRQAEAEKRRAASVPEPLPLSLRTLGWRAALPTTWPRLDDRGLKILSWACVAAAAAPVALYWAVIGLTLLTIDFSVTVPPRWFDVLFAPPVRTAFLWWPVAPSVVYIALGTMLDIRKRRRADGGSP